MNVRCSVFLVCLTALVGQAAARDTRLEQGWIDYRNERFGFTLRYPGDLFELEKASEAGDGQVFVARGGQARLLVGAMPNDRGQSPAAYQDTIARQSYAGYRIGYRRLAGSWFVLSGEGNGKTFYEKVIFSCGGRLINSFAMIYPTDQRRVFDPIVEGIEASFRPARECDGRAAARPLTSPPPRRSATERLGRGQEAHDLQWRTASRGKEDTTSSSSCGGRARPTITKSCAATLRASRLHF